MGRTKNERRRSGANAAGANIAAGADIAAGALPRPPIINSVKNSLNPMEKENVAKMLNNFAREIRDCPEVSEKPLNHQGVEKALNRARKIFEQGGEEKKTIMLRFINKLEQHKTANDRHESKTNRRRAESRMFLQSLATEIRMQSVSPTDAFFDFEELEQEACRFRHQCRKGPPICLLNRCLGNNPHAAQTSRLGISAEKQYLLNPGLVPYPSDLEHSDSAKVASRHIFYVHFNEREDEEEIQEPPAPAAVEIWVKQEPESDDGVQPTPDKAEQEGSRASEQHRRRRASDHNQQSSSSDRQSPLPHIVLEIGHIVITNPTSTDKVATGLGIFADLDDPKRSLWLLWTKDFTARSADDQHPLDEDMERFLLRNNLNSNCGNVKLASTMGLWMNVYDIEQQLSYLANGFEGSTHRHVRPTFERFLVPSA